jgi:hypothetical protein
MSKLGEGLLIIHSSYRAQQHHIECLRPIFGLLLIYGYNVAMFALEALKAQFGKYIKLVQTI